MWLLPQFKKKATVKPQNQKRSFTIWPSNGIPKYLFPKNKNVHAKTPVLKCPVKTLGGTQISSSGSTPSMDPAQPQTGVEESPDVVLSERANFRRLCWGRLHLHRAPKTAALCGWRTDEQVSEASGWGGGAVRCKGGDPCDSAAGYGSWRRPTALRGR